MGGRWQRVILPSWVNEDDSGTKPARSVTQLCMDGGSEGSGGNGSAAEGYAVCGNGRATGTNPVCGDIIIGTSKWDDVMWGDVTSEGKD